jgi:hypothetical protein
MAAIDQWFGDAVHGQSAVVARRALGGRLLSDPEPVALPAIETQPELPDQLRSSIELCLLTESVRMNTVLMPPDPPGDGAKRRHAPHALRGRARKTLPR